mmetsp:Transcript_1107/g.2698  ORF Transcript_1107/g.2698 Transcript_1107/m.2698 type:complete len:130 (-) Transcript_1107:1204-1593(-)
MSRGNREIGWGAPEPNAKAEERNFNPWDIGTTVTNITTIETSNAGSLAGQVAAPPSSYAGQHVVELSVLNERQTIPAQPEPGIDLSLLTSAVKPLELINEGDELWDYQHLIIEVSQAIRQEAESQHKLT